MPFPHFSLPTLAADHDSAVNYGKHHPGVNFPFVKEKLRNINSFSASIGNGSDQKNDAGGFQHATATLASEPRGTDAIRCRGRAIAPADGQPLAGRPPDGTGTDGAAPTGRSGGRHPGAPTATERINFRTLALAATALACVAGSAGANPVQINSPGAAQNYGDGAAAAATARAAATASPVVTSTGGSAQATINITRGGGGGNGNGASRGAGAGTPSAAGTNGTNSSDPAGVNGTNGRGGGGNVVDARSAPSIATMAPAAGGQCGVVGFGLGATGTTGGGILSGSWESTNCAARINAQMLAEWGYKPQAVALLRARFSDVDDAFKASAIAAPVSIRQPEPSDSGAAIDLCAARPGWTAAQLARQYPECRR